MKVIEQTATQLAIADRNRQWLWGTAFGVPFMAIGLIYASLSPQGQGVSGQALLAGAMFFVPGLVVLIRGFLTPMQTQCSFDKSLNQATLEKCYRLHGKQVTNLSLTEVKQAYFTRVDFPTQRNPWYVLKFELKSGGFVRLSPPVARQQAIHLTDTINFFLGVHPA